MTIDTSTLDEVEVSCIYGWDAPDYSDAFISRATWASTGKELTEDELDELNDDTSFVYDQILRYLY